MTQRTYDPSSLLHPPLVGAGATLLIAAFATDLVYWRSLLFQWNNFSAWLLTAGLVLAAIAGLALLVDVLWAQVPAMAWGRFAGFTAASLLSLLNAYVHSRDAYTAVVPQGLELSALVTAIVIILGTRGWSLRAAGPANHPTPKETRP